MSKRYTQEEIGSALLAYWLEGESATRAAKATGVPSTTLARWVQEDPARYREAVDKARLALDKRVLENFERIILRGQQVTVDAIELAQKQIDDGQVKDAGSLARNLATTVGISSDKWLVLQGRPSHITDTRDASDHLKALRDRFPWLVVDSTAEEMPAPPAEIGP